jgi:hypothetical protein
MKISIENMPKKGVTERYFGGLSQIDPRPEKTGSSTNGRERKEERFLTGKKPSQDSKNHNAKRRTTYEETLYSVYELPVCHHLCLTVLEDRDK